MKKILIAGICGLGLICSCFFAMDSKPSLNVAGSGGNVNVRV